MNKSVKAALFSALIFPGAGQLLLKKYISAAYFAGVAGVGLYLLLSDLMAIAQSIIVKVEQGEVSADLVILTELVHQEIMTNTASLTPGLIIVLVAWLVSVLEAYRLGNKAAS